MNRAGKPAALVFLCLRENYICPVGLGGNNAVAAMVFQYELVANFSMVTFRDNVCFRFCHCIKFQEVNNAAAAAAITSAEFLFKIITFGMPFYKSLKT